MLKTDFNIAANSLLRLSQTFKKATELSETLEEKIKFQKASSIVSSARNNLISLAFDAEDAEFKCEINIDGKGETINELYSNLL